MLDINFTIVSWIYSMVVTAMFILRIYLSHFDINIVAGDACFGACRT